MAAKLIRRKSGQSETAETQPLQTAISPEAAQAWGRIPQQNKFEIIEAVGRPQIAGADTKTVKVGAKLFTVQRVSSGFRVVYEPGNDRNTIVSVLTPREALLVQD